MQFMSLAFLSTLIAGALAAEGVHLVNCDGPAGQGSVVVYCADDSNCNNVPTGPNECEFRSESTYHLWEGSSQSCEFGQTGVSFSWNIESNAQSQATYSQVGTGSNGFHNFNIFKDDQHTMWSQNGQNCKSVYYALDA
ncbi:hypothetical protein F4809DRAFT_350434 [Biscogniauxia mediterranea]|nr:hypothetical protein F4809DRAFT_350434 [Biscogniauxia mediterranea]